VIIQQPGRRRQCKREGGRELFAPEGTVVTAGPQYKLVREPQGSELSREVDGSIRARVVVRRARGKEETRPEPTEPPALGPDEQRRIVGRQLGRPGVEERTVGRA
jgi:hypothetical protein